MKKYDLWEHGIGTKVFNIKTRKFGTVVDIKEIGFEWIEPFVRYEGSEDLVKERPDDLVLGEGL